MGDEHRHGPRDERGEQNAPKPSERKIITFTRLDRIERKPLTWVIEGVLPENSLASLTGKSGSGKSFAGIGQAASVGTGTPWMGHAASRGAVFYLGGEGHNGIRKRFDGWSQFHGVSLEGAPIYIASGLPALCDELNVAAVIDEVSTIAEDLFFNSGGVEPRLFVVDTFARAMAGGDENSAADVGRIIGGLDWIRERWGCCVQVIHHTGHGEGTKNRARGSSAFYAALDSELLVSSDGKAIRIACTKAKDWQPMPELVLDRHIVHVDTDGVPETTLVLERCNVDDELSRARELREEVRRLKAAGGPTGTVRGIAEVLGVTKAKVEHELRMLAKAEEYERASNGE